MGGTTGIPGRKGLRIGCEVGARSGRAGLIAGAALLAGWAAAQPQLAWERAYRPDPGIAYANDLIALPTGGALVVGTRAASPNAPSDALLVRYADDGATDYVRTYAGPGDVPDEGLAVGVDGSGNPFVLVQSGSTAAVAKFSASGNPLWAYRYPIEGTEEVEAVGFLVLSDGSVYLGLTKTAANGASSDAILVKLGVSGTKAWERNLTAGLGGFNRATGLALYPDGDVAVALTRYSGLETGYDVGLARYGPLGELRWSAIFDGPRGWDRAGPVAVDSQGRAYVAAESWGEIVTVKFGPSGEVLWFRPAGITTSNGSVRAIALDGTGNVFVAGSSDQETGFLMFDAVLLSYDPQGTLRWKRTYVGPQGGTDLATGLAVDPSGAAVLSVNSGADPADSKSHMVLLRYAPDGTPTWTLTRTVGEGDLWPTRAEFDGANNVYVAAGHFGKASGDELLVFKYGTSQFEALTVEPAAVRGGEPAVGRVHLTMPAPEPGLTIALASDHAAAVVPSQVMVPAGSTSATFTIATSPTPATVVATIRGTLASIEREASLTIVPVGLASFSVQPDTVDAGEPATGELRLTGPAPPGGLAISLRSSDVAAASVPPTITVPAGASSATFTVATYAVEGNVSVVLSARHGQSYLEDGLTVRGARLVSLTIDPEAVRPGAIAVGTVRTSLPAGPAGFRVLLRASPGLTVPGQILLPSGTSTASFEVRTASSARGVGTVTARFAGSELTAELRVREAELVDLSILPDRLTEGGTAVGTIRLDGPAGASGALVRLSGQSAVARFPSEVLVPAGRESASFSVQTAATERRVTVRLAAAVGDSRREATLEVVPVGLESATFVPARVRAGDPARLRVTLREPAPPGGAKVSLVPHPRGIATVPGSLVVPAGARSGEVRVDTSARAGSGALTVTATRGDARVEARLELEAAPERSASPTLAEFVLEPPVARYGQSVEGRVRLSGPAPETGVDVRVDSRSPLIEVPRGVEIPPGRDRAAFPVRIVRNDSGSAPITVEALGSRSTAILTVLAAEAPSSPADRAEGPRAGEATPVRIPPLVPMPSNRLPDSRPAAEPRSRPSFRLRLESIRLEGGSPLTGRVLLSSPAPAGGVTVALSSSHPALQPPASVVVPQGRAESPFLVTTRSVAETVTCTLTGAAAGQTQRVRVELLPPSVAGLELEATHLPSGRDITGSVKLSRPAPPGGVEVTVEIAPPELGKGAVAVRVAEGQWGTSFSLGTKRQAETAQATVRARLRESEETSLVMLLGELEDPTLPRLKGFELGASTLDSGAEVEAVVTLDRAAPPGGIEVAIDTDRAILEVPETVRIEEGSRETRFSARAGSVGRLTIPSISVTWRRETLKKALQVHPPRLAEASPTARRVVPGEATTIEVTLSAPAPPEGLTILIRADRADLVELEPEARILPGQTSVRVPVRTRPQARAKKVWLTIQAGGSRREIALEVGP